MSEEEAREYARVIALEEGWPWLPPVKAKRKESRAGGAAIWEVVSNADSLGANVKIVFEEESRHVLKKNYLPR